MAKAKPFPPPAQDKGGKAPPFPPKGESKPKKK